MTSKLISVSTVGVNKIGTLSKYFKAIANNNGNIQHSALYNHNNIFVMNANIEFSRDTNLNFLYPNFHMNNSRDSTDILKHSWSDAPFYAVVNETNYNQNNNSQVINIDTTYADTSGIVANQIALLEKSDCKISNFSSDFIPAPHSCTPIFSFNISAHFNNNNHKINDLIDKIRHQNALHDCKIDINGKYIEFYEGMGF